VNAARGGRSGQRGDARYSGQELARGVSQCGIAAGVVRWRALDPGADYQRTVDDGFDRLDRDRLRIVAAQSVRGSAFFIPSQHVTKSMRHERTALYRAVDQRASKVGRRAMAVRLWRLQGENVVLAVFSWPWRDGGGKSPELRAQRCASYRAPLTRWRCCGQSVRVPSGSPAASTARRITDDDAHRPRRIGLSRWVKKLEAVEKTGILSRSGVASSGGVAYDL
jgi:hypothetical protein